VQRLRGVRRDAHGRASTASSASSIRASRLDKDIYSLSRAELAEVPSMPGLLEIALDNLERDHDFLLKGDVFTESVIETWIGYKREREVDQMRLRPHPWEFALYYDA
jgi:glutamine synthetase